MMGGRTWDEWIEEYSHAHEHPINRLWIIALSLFIVGWILQFIGHYFEGKPPEFMKDWRFLFVGLRWWIKKTLG
jgi:uncharacterized membrane protein YGL010W